MLTPLLALTVLGLHAAPAQAFRAPAADEAGAIAAPWLQTRPVQGEVVPANSRLYAQFDYAYESIAVTGELYRGEVTEPLSFESQCGAGDNVNCLFLATPALTEGELPTLQLTGDSASYGDSLTAYADFEVGPVDDDPPEAIRVSARELLWYPWRDDSQDRFLVQLGVPPQLEDDVAVVEIARVDGEELTTMHRQLVAVPGEAPFSVGFELRAPDPVSACYTVILHDLAGNKTRAQDDHCFDIAPENADNYDEAIQQIGGCSHVQTRGGLGLAPFVLGVLGLALRRRRSR